MGHQVEIGCICYGGPENAFTDVAYLIRCDGEPQKFEWRSFKTNPESLIPATKFTCRKCKKLVKVDGLHHHGMEL